MRSRCPASINPGMECSPRSKAAAPARSMRRASFAGKKLTTRSPGTRQSRWKLLVRSAIPVALMWLVAAMFALPCAAGAQGLRAYAVVGDAIPESLTGMPGDARSEEHTSELQSHLNLVCRLLLEKKKPSRRPPTRRRQTAWRDHSDAPCPTDAP